jgi:8-oxo-dGTP pyrophosphatase MutT (NUDIX family)
MKFLTTAFIFHKDKLLLVFHRKLQKWMHVGGHVEEDEYFDDALFREIKEETGLKVKILNQKKKISKYELSIPFFVRAGDNKENSTAIPTLKLGYLPVEFSNSLEGLHPQHKCLGIRPLANKKNKTILLDYICEVEGSPKITLQKKELLDYKWIGEEEIDAIDTYPLLKTLAKKAFKVYNKR